MAAHTQADLDRNRAATADAATGPVHLDAATVVSAGTWEATLRAVGAGLRTIDAVIDRGAGVANAFCQIRPPSHHDEHERAMGFCLFNAVAVAALHAEATHGAERVAVVDFDVHHGDGTPGVAARARRFAVFAFPAMTAIVPASAGQRRHLGIMAARSAARWSSHRGNREVRGVIEGGPRCLPVPT